MKVLNLTQHKANKTQIEYGIIDLPEKLQNKLQQILTFDEIPNEDEILNKAYAITDLLYKYFYENTDNIVEDFSSKVDKLKKSFEENEIDGVMIGGALWLMKPLIEELWFYTKPYFAFSKREVIEVEKEDGSIEKKAIFKFEGLIEAV